MKFYRKNWIIYKKMTSGIYKFIRSQNILKYSCHVRYISTSQVKLKEEDAEEVKIPVPWGHISGKWWGNKSSPSVLAIHGWQDNANSFDRLIPLLNVSSVLAIDLPGHGHSSHLPKGCTYDFPGFIIMLHRIKKYFNWGQMPLLTHSFGGALGYVYSSVFPNEIKWHINLDCARGLLTLCREDLSKEISEEVDNFLRIEKQKEEESPPIYKLSEMIQKRIMGSFGSVTTPEAALILLKREICLAENFPARKKSDSDVISSNLGNFIKYEKQRLMLLPEEEQKNLTKKYLAIIESYKKVINELKKFHISKDDDKYFEFIRDPSMKTLVFQSFSEEFIIEASRNIKSPILSIRAKDGFLNGCTSKLYEKTLDILKQNSAYLEHHEVDGKWWGSKSRRPILCLHGWQDNANSFKTLIPLLSSEFSYLAIDLPGHGFSSHLPKGFFYEIYGVINTIRRIQFHFNWENVSLMGHSLGAACCYSFASCYPKTVDFFIAIDVIKPVSGDYSKEFKNASKTIESMLVQDNLNVLNAPAYKKNELIQRWIKGTNNSVTENTCQILMERGTKEKENLFRLTRDVRLKFSFTPSFSQKELLKMAESIICSVLFIKAIGVDHFEKEENVLEVLNVIEKKAKHFQRLELPGTHHIHLNTPQVVAPVINSFIETVANH